MRYARPKKPKIEKPLKPNPRPHVVAYRESDLSIAARRHSVTLRSGSQRSLDGERIEGDRGYIYEGWETFCLWFWDPLTESEMERFLESFITGKELLNAYSIEIQRCIEEAKAAGLDQHERSDHAHFFRWNAKDDQKTAVALKLIGARDNGHKAEAPAPREAEDEIIIESQIFRRRWSNGR